MAMYGQVWPNMTEYGRELLKIDYLIEYREYWPIMDHYNQVWRPSMAEYAWIWSRMAKYSPVRLTKLTKYDQMWPNMGY